MRDIKAGTLIYKEKLQFVLDDSDCVGVLDMMKCFYDMTENDQKEFLELHNKYLDLNSLPNSEKKWYFDCKNMAEDFARQAKKQAPGHLAPCFDSNLVLKIFCIHSTNDYGVRESGSIGIKVSRINHSCCPNSEPMKRSGGEMAIRATSKILEGQEITINYAGTNDMRKLKERRHGFQIYGFVCSCDLCQNEEINDDNEIYDKFQNLKKEAEEIFSNFMSLAKQDSHLEQYDKLVKAIAYQKEMYNLAKKKIAPKLFILRHIIEKAFMQGVTGYEFASLDFSCFQKNYDKMEYFKSECEKLSMVGYQIAKMCYGREGKMTKEWKERNQDFENWCKTFLKSRRK